MACGKALLILLAFSAIAFSACNPGEVTSAVCDASGVLYFKECAGGSFVARERSCLGEGKACDAGLADCVPAGNCTNDIVEACADGSNVTVAKCNFRETVFMNRVVYIGVAQPTSQTCAGGCAAGFTCGFGGEEFNAQTGGYSVRVALRELGLDGGVRSQVVNTLKEGEGASLYDLTIVFAGVESNVTCLNETEFIVKSKKAVFNITWGAVHEAAALGEGEASGKYCTHFVSGVPCSELDVDFFVASDGISQDVSCVMKAAPSQPPLQNITQQNATAPNATQPNASQPAPTAPYPNFTRPTQPAQNATPIAPLEEPKCLPFFICLSALLLAFSWRE
jgi:hypothetical protein